MKSLVERVPGRRFAGRVGDEPAALELQRGVAELPEVGLWRRMVDDLVFGAHGVEVTPSATEVALAVAPSSR